MFSYGKISSIPLSFTLQNMIIWPTSYLFEIFLFWNSGHKKQGGETPVYVEALA